MSDLEDEMYKALLGARDVFLTIEMDATVRRALKRIDIVIAKAKDRKQYMYNLEKGK